MIAYQKSRKTTNGGLLRCKRFLCIYIYMRPLRLVIYELTKPTSAFVIRAAYMILMWRSLLEASITRCFFLLFHSFPMNQSPLVKQMTLSAVVDDDEMSPGRKSPRDTLHNLIHIEPYSSGRRWRTTKTVPEFMTFYHRIAYIKPFFFCIFSS